MYSNLVDTIGFLKGIDPDVADAMDKELARQKRNLELIASENIVSPAVMAAMGLLTTMLGFDETLTSLMVALYLAQDSFGTACNVTGDGAIAVLVDAITGKNKNKA